MFLSYSSMEIKDLAYQDFTVMVDILRNEEPVRYDGHTGVIYTDHEYVGSEESTR